MRRPAPIPHPIPIKQPASHDGPKHRAEPSSPPAIFRILSSAARTPPATALFSSYRQDNPRRSVLADDAAMPAPFNAYIFARSSYLPESRMNLWH